MEIIPAIIPKDIKELEEKLGLVRGVVPVVQIDVLDGKFVPDVSWPLGDGQEIEWRKIVSQENTLPYCDEFFFEADLMVENPEKLIDNFIFAGFGRIIVHIESTKNMGVIIERCRELDVEIGIAIGIETSNDILDEWIDKIDVVQCMGIARIGYQGEVFDERVVEKISNIKASCPDIIISVDGGVNPRIASYLLGVGANRLVSGSAIFERGDIEKVLQDFYALER